MSRKSKRIKDKGGAPDYTPEELPPITEEDVIPRPTILYDSESKSIFHFYASCSLHRS